MAPAGQPEAQLRARQFRSEAGLIDEGPQRSAG